jgi:hypothetical protein
MKAPTPKLDALRAMREGRFKSATVPTIKSAIAAVPVKRAPKVKREVKP